MNTKNLITLIICVSLTGYITFYIVRNVYQDKVNHLEKILDDLLCENQILSEKIRLIDENFGPIRHRTSQSVLTSVQDTNSMNINSDDDVVKGIKEISKILDTVKIVQSQQLNIQLINSLKSKIKE